jgi:UDP:flavonoid glycosyltransferase YjiC (YdhE family)
LAKALFFPNYLGGGFGHSARCLALAECLRERGWESAFVIDGPHRSVIEKAGFKTLFLTMPPMSPKRGGGPAYVLVPNLSYQVVRDGFHNSRIVKAAVRQATDIVRCENPDVLIGDGYLLTGILGKRAGIPVVQFVKSVVHPNPVKMVWWEEEPKDLKPPDIRSIFGRILNRADLPPATQEGFELLSGDLLLLPSIPVLDPMDPIPKNTFYVGPIIRKTQYNKPMPEWFKALDSNRPIVYVTIGGAAGGDFQSFFRLVVGSLKGMEAQVVVSTGGVPFKGEAVPENMLFVDWVPGVEMIARSSLVVFHGGYSRMEVLSAGLPSIVIPFHSEQEYYGRLMEKAGVSRLLLFSNEPYRLVWKRWKGGSGFLSIRKFSVAMRFQMTLDSETFRYEVARALEDSEMLKRARALQSELRESGGVAKAADIIQEKLHLK